ncbi:MAG: cation diffusion facilitator family transporter [Prevotellaceae bacterium]|jgi:cation diffusion facilitator family transporter|nr:cation diffusion facilitator family transporter [Prevotellaceae bacterium]
MSNSNIMKKTSWVSMAGNAILATAKIVLGLLAGSVAVVSDGVDSSADVAISIIMIFTANLVNRPPSRKYVYGYTKAENIATKVLSIVILYAGIQMLIASGKSIFSGAERTMPTVIAIYVTLFSIVGKLLLAYYQYRQGKRINSSLLKANAVNMRNDVLISVSVLIGLFLTFGLKLPILDAVVGLLVSLFIIRSAFSIFMDSNVELMDGVKDETVYNRIFEAVDRVDGAKNPHRVRSHQIGSHYLILLDIEVDGNLSLLEAHLIANQVETGIKQAVENVYDIVVHVEPTGVQHHAEKFGVCKEMIDLSIT